MAKKNAKTTGCRGTLANAHDLAGSGLVAAVRAAVKKVDDPGDISNVGNRGPGPEIIVHISFSHPIGCGRRSHTVSVGLLQFFLSR